jgi:hypothetical protein
LTGLLGWAFGWNLEHLTGLTVLLFVADWLHDLDNDLRAVERRLNDEAEQRRIEKLAESGRDAKGQFISSQVAE